MRTTRRRLIQGAGAVSATTAIPGFAAAATERFAEMTAVLDAAVASGAVPWAVFTLVTEDKVVFAHAAGVAVDHVDVLRSATKIATVSAVMTLVQSGAIALDDPVSRFVPAFSGDKAQVRVRHLLSMSSGLPSSWAGVSDEMPLSLAAEAIARAPLRAAPGERFIYGNLGLTVAGRVAEAASGRPWPEFFQQALAAPLGMNFTYGPLETGRLGGGGRTDIASYGRLLQLHLASGAFRGRRILSQALVAEMARSNGARFVNPIPQTTAFGYGMGWWFDELRPDGAARVISDPGAWGAYPWIDLDRRYGAFLFVRKALGDGVALQRRLRPLVEAALVA